MGIPKLNKILVERCSQRAIYKIHLEHLYKKKIAVDISIYLYRFLGDGNFMEHVYLFLSLFKYYCIEPIFVFDGKPPPEKKGTIKKRKMEKCAAKAEYELLEKQLSYIVTPERTTEIHKRMETLKKKMIKLKWEHIDKVIELIQSFGFVHYLAPHEADQLCVHLAKRGDVYAILSDDMDMVISGCSLVIRNLNMSTHEAVIYDNDKIVNDLNISLEDLRKIVILSGTDYNASAMSIKKAFDIYAQYKKDTENDTYPFLEWLESNQLITDNFITIYNLFEPDNSELDVFLQAASPSPQKMSLTTIKDIMTPYRFIFL
jgi:flap endonuclease-1